MTIDEHVKHWIDSADNDLESAQILFNSKKYDWCLFLGHLVIEKAIKAIFVLNNQNKIPPKTHNLVNLADLSNLKLNSHQEVFLGQVNGFNIEARYPQYKQELYKLCTKDFAADYFHRIKDFYKWIKSQIK